LWVCEDHGKIIDLERGKNYPASLLQAWKALQESRIAQELRKVSITQFGWLERITVEKNPLFENGTAIVLGKVTLFVGRNRTGKSALCEWISGSAGNVHDLWRWSGIGDRLRELNLRLTVLRPDRFEFVMHFQEHDLTCEYGGKRAPDLSHAIRVLYIQDGMKRRAWEDDAEFLARLWGIHLYQVPQVLRDLCSSKYGYVKDAELRIDSAEEPGDGVAIEPPAEFRNQRGGRHPVTLYARIGDLQDSIPYALLSSSEMSQVIVSGAMVVADHYSAHKSTLLILELGGQLLPDELLSSYSQKLQGADFRFQTIFVSPSERPRVGWTGWSIARFIGKPPLVKIEQNSIERDAAEVTDPS
jgi:hypothetical protein